MGQRSVEAPLVAFSTGIRTPIGAVFTIPFFLICGLAKEKENDVRGAGAGEGVGNDVGKELRLDMLKRSLCICTIKRKTLFRRRLANTHSFTHKQTNKQTNNSLAKLNQRLQQLSPFLQPLKRLQLVAVAT